MLHKCNCSLVILALSVGVVDVARAGVVYNESVSGDLSGNGLTPTLVSLALGSNQVFGSTGRNADGVVDRDYFTFTVPGGLQWSALLVLPGTTTIGQLGFIGLELGNQLTLPTTTITAAGLLGWRHYNTADINTDILPEVGVPANGSSGFIFSAELRKLYLVGPGDRHRLIQLWLRYCRDLGAGAPDIHHHAAGPGSPGGIPVPQIDCFLRSRLAFPGGTAKTLLDRRRQPGLSHVQPYPSEL